MQIRDLKFQTAGTNMEAQEKPIWKFRTIFPQDGIVSREKEIWHPKIQGNFALFASN